MANGQVDCTHARQTQPEVPSGWASIFFFKARRDTRADGSRGHGGELEEIAETFNTDVLRAMAAHARGAIELAEGDARAVLGPLRRAFETWRQVEVPYEAARVRVLMGLACRLLGDDEGGGLELDAARAVFERLGDHAPFIAVEVGHVGAVSRWQSDASCADPTERQSPWQH
jgi:hypothetical protein